MGCQPGEAGPRDGGQDVIAEFVGDLYCPLDGALAFAGLGCGVV